MQERSTRSEIFADYFGTTAQRSHRATEASYQSWSATQGRRFDRVIAVGSGVRVVDLACGTGELLYHLEAKGFTDLSGVDVSQSVLDAGQPFLERSTLICADVFDFMRAAEQGSFGLITALNLVEHLKKEDLADFFRLLHRCLTPGGQFIMVVPNAVSPFGTVSRYWDITHETSFSPNSVRQLSILGGFESAPEFMEVGPVVHGVKSAIRAAAWQLIRVAIRTRLAIESGTARTSVFTQDMIVSLVKRQTPGSERP